MLLVGTRILHEAAPGLRYISAISSLQNFCDAGASVVNFGLMKGVPSLRWIKDAA